MSIVWFDDKQKNGSATLYDSNITLNKVAINHFADSTAVMLGIDYGDKKVFIKPLKDPDSSVKPKYNITIGSSYGRISNKEFMKEIARILDINFTNPLKVPAKWDNNEELLIVYLTGRESD